MSFLRKGILVSGGQLLCIVLNMLAGILFSRQLGPDGMGQYQLLRSTAAIAIAFTCAGLSNASIFFLNSRRVAPVEVVTNSIKAGAVLGAFATVALTAAILVFPGYFGHISVLVALIFALGAAANICTFILRAVVVAQSAVRRMVAIDLAVPAILLGVGAPLGLFGWLRPQSALILLALGFFGGLVLALLYVHEHIDLSRHLDWKLLRGLVVYGVKLASGNLLMVLASAISVMLLRYLRPGEFTEVGLYSRAVAVCGLIGLVPRALGPLLYAKWSALEGEARIYQVEMAARMSVAYGIPAAIAVTLVGKYVIWILYGAQFVPAHEALIILAPALIMMAVFEVYNNLLAGGGRAAITAYILAGTVVILSTVTWLTVPAWGIKGAAFGALCGNAFTALTSMVACCKLYGLNPRRCFLLRRSDVAYARQALWR